MIRLIMLHILNALYIKIIFLAVLLAKLGVLMIDLASQLSNTDSIEAIIAGYAINCLMQEVIK